jgi:6-pyruvoyltetrahydropterin/6-carboxytetrahydropterin synthase
MKMDIAQDFTFEAAHFLPKVPEGHKCRRLHGHSYKVTIQVGGQVDEQKGWIIDFFDIDEAVRPVRERLDHYLLNEVPGLSNPTSENIARFVWDQIVGKVPGLSEVVVHETCQSRSIYRGGH